MKSQKIRNISIYSAESCHTAMRGKNLLIYIDDCSRKVMSHVVGSETTRNSLFGIYRAIADNEVIPFELNSDRGTQFFPNKKDKNGKSVHEF